MKQPVHTCCAVSAAQRSKLAWSVCKRLRLFEGKGASFVTVIYTACAACLALQKPIFLVGLTLIVFGSTLGTGIWDICVAAVLCLPYILPNLARAACMCFAVVLVWGANHKVRVCFEHAVARPQAAACWDLFRTEL